MQLLSVLLSSALLLAAQAAPTTSPLDERDILKRGTQRCAIVSSDGPVHCRWGPDKDSNNHANLPDGKTYLFKCYKKGTCYKGNCTWDFIPELNCYVNGYYTDNHCTAAKLGLCDDH